MGKRKGSKYRLLMHSKRMNNHFSIKRQIHEQRLNSSNDVTGPDENYGQLELETDMPTELFMRKKEEFLAELLQSNNEELERNTVGQGENSLWVVERRKRLTASNFGKICKLRKKTSATGLLKSLLYSQFKGTQTTNYGEQKEQEAVEQFMAETGLQVSSCGLFIDGHKRFLAASPDGLIGEDSIVEVKCPFKIAKITPMQGIQQKKVDFCTIEGDQLKLKKNHNYYYQVQGQLHITRRKFCYFILWSPKGLLYQVIEKDDAFWYQMEPLLEKFYLECLLPELVDSRIPRNLPVRERSENN